MLSIFRLIRLPNLIIVALSMVLVRYCLIMPAFKAEYFAVGTFPTHLSGFQFILLIISTIIIAAAGYMINDYFDVHIDEINRPGKNIVGKKIDAGIVRKLFFILNIVGVGIGFYLAFIIKKPILGGIQLFTSVSLWMYSSFYKRRFLSGNLIISILCALSIMLTGLFEPEFYRNIQFLAWYGILAFLITFVREIIKDIEDIDGDELSQCKTMPIVWGVSKSKILIQLLIAFVLTFITFILKKYFFTNNVINFWYLLAFFYIPFLALSSLIISAKEKKDFHYAGLFTKILMVAGILTLLPFWYYFIK